MSHFLALLILFSVVVTACGRSGHNDLRAGVARAAKPPNVKGDNRHIDIVPPLAAGSVGGVRVAVSQRKFVNPTGTFALLSRSSVRGGQRYGPSSVVAVNLIDSTTIAVSFYADKGAPSYNSGSFVDTLRYDGHVAIHTTKWDSTCRMILTFAPRGLHIETASALSSPCGFGHGVLPHGYYRRTSSRRPIIRNFTEQ